MYCYLCQAAFIGCDILFSLIWIDMAWYAATIIVLFIAIDTFSTINIAYVVRKKSQTIKYTAICF